METQNSQERQIDFIMNFLMTHPSIYYIRTSKDFIHVPKQSQSLFFEGAGFYDEDLNAVWLVD